MPYCSNCGTEISMNMAYCPNCGIALAVQDKSVDGETVDYSPKPEVFAYKEDLNWFQRHLNLTLVIVVIGGWLLCYVVAMAMARPLPPVLFFVWIAVTFGISGWVLQEKGRSLWNLLWFLLNFIGLIVFLCMENKRQASGQLEGFEQK